MKNLKAIILVTFIGLILGCNNNTEDSPAGPANLSVKLVDAPGDFDHVYVDVVEVMVKYETENEEESEWQSLEMANEGIYDLLELTGGVDVTLVDNIEIEAGTLKQVRLVLGENNSIVVDGEELPLNTPSAQQSGLKIQVDQELEPNFNYTFILDFDVEESIVFAGNSGNINLKPVLRASLEANSGIISGSVLPLEIAVEVTAVSGDNEATTFTDSEGNFLIAGLPEGTYEVTVTPDPDSGLEPLVISDVTVTVGEVTDLGEITLE